VEVESECLSQLQTDNKMTAGWSFKPQVDLLFSKRPGLIVVIREMALVLVILDSRMSADMDETLRCPTSGHSLQGVDLSLRHQVTAPRSSTVVGPDNVLAKRRNNKGMYEQSLIDFCRYWQSKRLAQS
jgi:hypothetical protein